MASKNVSRLPNERPGEPLIDLEERELKMMVQKRKKSGTAKTKPKKKLRKRVSPAAWTAS